MGIAKIERQIMNYVLTECKMDKVGIASIDRFNESPEGYHPTDFLPGCKSVIAFCTRLPDGAVNAAHRAMEDRMFHLHGVYGAFGYSGAPNFNLNMAIYKTAMFVEGLTGCAATCNTCGPMTGSKMMSMRHCAAAAGLGEFGWSSIMLTPEFGPRNRFGAVLTTAELEPTPLYNGPKLCDPSKCHVCEKMCPSGAIPAYDERIARIIKMGEKEMCYAPTSWTKCRLMCEGVYADYNPTGTDLVDPNLKQVNTEDLMPAVRYFSKNPSNVYIQHGPTWKCGNCLTYCPVGNWKERFYDTGISRVNISKYIDDGWTPPTTASIAADMIKEGK